MKQKHVPDLELCQEFDRLCKEKGIVVPETEFYWMEKGCKWILVHKTDDGMCSETGLMHYEWMTLLPAPLVSEQLEWLPKFTKISRGDGNTNAHLYIHPDEYDRFENSPSNAAQGLINDLIAEEIITNL